MGAIVEHGVLLGEGGQLDFDHVLPPGGLLSGLVLAGRDPTLVLDKRVTISPLGTGPEFIVRRDPYILLGWDRALLDRLGLHRLLVRNPVQHLRHAILDLPHPTSELSGTDILIRLSGCLLRGHSLGRLLPCHSRGYLLARRRLFVISHGGLL